LEEVWSSRLSRWYRSGLYLSLLSGVSLVFPLGSSVLLTRLFQKEQYGLYAYFLAFLLMVDFTSLPGVATSVIQAAARGFAGTVRVATGVRRRSSLIGSAILLVIAVHSYVIGRSGDAVLFACSAAAFPFYFPYTNFLSYLNGISDFRRMLFYQVIHLSAIYFPVLIAAYWSRDFRVPLLTHLMVAPLFRYLIYRRVVRGIPEDAEVEEGYLQFGTALTLLSLFATIEANLDRIIVGGFFSPVQLATFHIGKTIAVESRSVWNVAYQYILPSLSRDLAQARFPRKLFLVLFIYLVALTAFFIAVPWVIDFLYPDEYKESVITARWFLFAVMLGGTGAVVDTFLVAGGRLKALWTVRISKMVCYLSGLYWFVQGFGVTGIYYATVLAAAVYSLTAIFVVSFALRGPRSPENG